ncbi:hypothetical protein FSP39_023772 [Pinctada imbricata]|uniref:C17orf113 probable zinc finger domain-containing protein n=1 Tax=Pinctada imbricata TaxID=66713 RepID=A0AA88Y4J5_PINIB|nr:hypothetical protein FSP39_023772 [Pinctada imbricata]
MWRFIKGVEKPQSKRKAIDTSYFKEYDKSKRSRKFSEKWTETYSWLRDSASGMTCSICIDHDTTSKGSNSFINGCTSYKLDSIIKHEKSKCHQRSVLIQSGKSKPIEKTDAAHVIHSLNRENFNKLEKMFRNCHALVKNNRPLSDFTWLCDLDEMKGLDLGKTYRNKGYANTFIDCIAELEFKKVCEVIERANFLCIIGDGSTDSRIKEQEMWFVRTCVEGKIDVKLIGISALDKASAENIVKGLREILNQNIECEWEEIMARLVCLACDGASVMVGHRGGVSALLRKEQPAMITIHCMAHRLELCLKDACKSVHLFNKVLNTLIMGLFYFYHNSSLNRSTLMNTFEVLKGDDPKEKLLLPTKAGGTRWIGHHHRALTNIVTSYKYIVTHLSQLKETGERVSADSKSKATAYLRLLKSKEVVYFMLFVLDFLGPLRRLSLALQDQDGLISSKHAALASTLSALERLKER